jgi:hypothetical protein
MPPIENVTVPQVLVQRYVQLPSVAVTPVPVVPFASSVE